jgi:hypothetical protein
VSGECRTELRRTRPSDCRADVGRGHRATPGARGLTFQHAPQGKPRRVAGAPLSLDSIAGTLDELEIEANAERWRYCHRGPPVVVMLPALSSPVLLSTDFGELQTDRTASELLATNWPHSGASRHLMIKMLTSLIRQPLAVLTSGIGDSSPRRMTTTVALLPVMVAAPTLKGLDRKCCLRSFPHAVSSAAQSCDPGTTAARAI